MFRKVIRWLIIAAGALTGYMVAEDFVGSPMFLGFGLDSGAALLLGIVLRVVLAALCGVLALALSTFIVKHARSFGARLDRIIGRFRTSDFAFGLLGLLLGLVIAYFACGMLASLTSWLRLFLTLVIYGASVSVCVRAFSKHWPELLELLGKKQAAAAAEPPAAPAGTAAEPKLLDSSVLIDGRIVDIARAGFMEGTLVVPRFILEELQRVADSSDSQKRRRGRRGLDVAKELADVPGVTLDSGGYSSASDEGADMQLLRLAQTMGARIVTNDYNLNKVAALSGVKVMNINDLSNALKPLLLPGEEMQITVIKEGKEPNQGVAYLDDGTMTVVENGARHIGRRITVAVTSVLQTSAGRMIFAKPKDTAD